jgi:bifunctional UDP-N-acetylglucosamine pyrophosphorylase/glucosamine-1-phosphate N-acetyltransferase
MNQELHIVILAAGEGTRMKSHLPKVLHRIGGRPMITHLLDTAGQLEPAAIHVVIGSGAEEVKNACGDRPVNWVLQAERKGTGHAVMQAMPDIPDKASVMVLLGDHPLIPVSVLEEMKSHQAAPLAILTMELDKPKGYGRIERDRTGRITGIIEDKDATPAQWTMKEVNTGIIMADARELLHRGLYPASMFQVPEPATFVLAFGWFVVVLAFARRRVRRRARVAG